MQSADLLLATGNSGKLRDFRGALVDLPVRVLSSADLELGEGPEEVGASYEENAILKAAHGAHASGLPTLADDSGIEVDALGGAPGIYSARFGGKLSDGERIAYLLDQMRDVPEGKRGAAFVCVLALALPDGRLHTFRGRCEGRILEGPRGKGGHGYDPIFWSFDLRSSFGEVDEDAKAGVSHRGRAIASLREWLTGAGDVLAHSGAGAR